MFLFINAVGLVNSLEHFFVEVAIPMGWEEGIGKSKPAGCDIPREVVGCSLAAEHAHCISFGVRRLNEESAASTLSCEKVAVRLRESSWNI